MIIVMAVLMYRTKFGVYVRVVGENDDAARSLGMDASTFVRKRKKIEQGRE